VQAVAAKPTDRQVDLGFAHESPVVHEAQQEARQHQTDGDLGIDARPAVATVVEVLDLMQPAEIEDAIISTFLRHIHNLWWTTPWQLFNSPRVHWMRNALAYVL
jgi:hypothetical protein